MSKVNRRSFLKGLAVAAPVALTGDLTAESAQESVTRKLSGGFIDIPYEYSGMASTGAMAFTAMAMTENGIRKKTVR